MKKFFSKLKDNKGFQITKKILSIIVTILLVFIFFVILVQKLSNNRFNLGGCGIYTVASGSMEPKYKVKDLIFATRKDPSEIEIGDDIVYLGKKESVAGKIVTHRVISKSEREGRLYFYTKGISNELTDPEIDDTQILGVVRGKLPLLSLCSHIINSSLGLFLVVVVPFVIFVFCEGKRIIDEKNKD